MAETEIDDDAYGRALGIVRADSARRLDRGGSRGIDRRCARRRAAVARALPAAAARMLLAHATAHRWRADRTASRLLVAAVVAGASGSRLRRPARCPDGSTAAAIARLGMAARTWASAVDDLVTAGVVRRTPRTAIGADSWHATPELALTDACAWCSTADRRQQQLAAWRTRPNLHTYNRGALKACTAQCVGRVVGAARTRKPSQLRAAGDGSHRPPWLSDVRCPCCETGRLAWQPRERGGGLDAVCRACHRHGRRWHAARDARCVSCGGGVRLDRRDRLRRVLAADRLPVLCAPDRPPPPPPREFVERLLRAGATVAAVRAAWRERWHDDSPDGLPVLDDVAAAAAARRAAAADRGEIERAAPPPDADAARRLLLCGVSLAAHPVPRRRAWLSVTLWMRAPPMWLLLSSVSGLPEPGSAQPVLILRRLRRCMTPRRTSLPGRIGLLWCGVTLRLPGSLRPSGSPGSPARRAHCCGCPTVTPPSGETITAA